MALWLLKSVSLALWPIPAVHRASGEGPESGSGAGVSPLTSLSATNKMTHPSKLKTSFIRTFGYWFVLKWNRSSLKIKHFSDRTSADQESHESVVETPCSPVTSHLRLGPAGFGVSQCEPVQSFSPNIWS